MTFILVTLSVMGASIFLIYRLTNYFGFRMKYKSLFLCAFMAFIVNIAAISMSPYLTKEHYLRLVLLVIAAAAVVTIYNEYLVRRETAAAEGAEPADGEERPPDRVGLLRRLSPGRIPGALGSAFASLRRSGAKAVSALLGLLPSVGKAVPLPEEERLFPAEENPEPKPVPEPKQEISTGAASPEEMPAVPAAPLKEAAPPAPEQKKDAGKEPEQEKSLLQEPEQKKDAGKEPEPKTPAKEAKAGSTAREKAKPSVKPKEEAPKTDGFDASRFPSLDDLLDYAYEQKSKKRVEEAILAYKGALEKYRDDAYAPFIVIDLGNIYKERAAYQDAIRTYEDALSLPVIANDVATSAKFRENLAYLRTVRYILSKHGSLQLPFQEIPADYLKEIEAEFQLRQTHS